MFFSYHYFSPDFWNTRQINFPVRKALIDRPVLFEGWKADEVTEGELRKMRKRIPYVMCVATRCTHVHYTSTHICASMFVVWAKERFEKLSSFYKTIFYHVSLYNWIALWLINLQTVENFSFLGIVLFEIYEGQ